MIIFIDEMAVVPEFDIIAPQAQLLRLAQDRSVSTEAPLI